MVRHRLGGRAADGSEGSEQFGAAAAVDAGCRRHRAPVALPVPGELVDTFLLEEAIGVGGMGAVFRALDTKLDRQVALKLLPPDQASDAEVVQRFYQEGRAAARLDHENIARVFSIGQYDLFSLHRLRIHRGCDGTAASRDLRAPSQSTRR